MCNASFYAGCAQWLWRGVREEVLALEVAGWQGVRHLRPQRDLHRVGELLHAREDRCSAFRPKLDLLRSVVPDLLVRLRIRCDPYRSATSFPRTPCIRRRNDMHACHAGNPKIVRSLSCSAR